MGNVRLPVPASLSRTGVFSSPVHYLKSRARVFRRTNLIKLALSERNQAQGGFGPRSRRERVFRVAVGITLHLVACA